jgi:hypothetical protein
MVGVGAVVALVGPELRKWYPQKEGVKKMGLEEARDFVKKAVFEVENKSLEQDTVLNLGACCIDGRRPNNERENELPILAIPGADEGLMANVLSACNRFGLSIEDKKKILEELVKLRGGLKNLHFHTDDHSEHEHNPNIAGGCGHFRLSFEKPEDYGLTKEDVDLILYELSEILKEGGVREVLHGKHEESAVMLVDDPILGLKHNVDNRQVFVYNRALHRKLLIVIASKLKDLFKADAKDVEKVILEMNDFQLLATVNRLAVGQQMYSITKNQEGKVQVVEVGVVEPKKTK